MTKLYDEDGYTITLTEDKRFEAKGPELEERKFDTYAQALDGINRVATAEAKRQKRGLALLAYTDKGEEAVITGLHASRGVILSTPKGRESRRRGFRNEPDFYPRTPAVLALLQRRIALEEEMAKVSVA